MGKMDQSDILTQDRVPSLSELLPVGEGRDHLCLKGEVREGAVCHIWNSFPHDLGQTPSHDFYSGNIYWTANVYKVLMEV